MVIVISIVVVGTIFVNLKEIGWIEDQKKNRNQQDHNTTKIYFEEFRRPEETCSLSYSSENPWLELEQKTR